MASSSRARLSSLGCANGCATSTARGLRAAAFDTRGDARAAITGSAARGIAPPVAPPRLRRVDSKSFLVADAEGPLEDGELERAREWGAALAKTMAASTS